MADNATKIYKDLSQAIDQTSKQLEGLAEQAKKTADIQKILLSSAEQLTAEYSKSQNIKEMTNIQKELTKNTKALSLAQQNAKTITEEELRAKIRLQEAEKARRQTLRAEIQAENASVGSKQQLRAQNKLLRQESEQLNLETQEGTKRLKEINAQLDANNKKIKDNSDAYSKQKIEIGNYKENITEALKEQEVFGVSINKISGFFSSATGVIGAVIGVIGGLTKAYISSARGTNDLARASDRLDSILNDLGNTLADAGGEGGIFDRILGGLQVQLFGIASTVKSSVIVAIKESLRELEVLEIEQERQKKAQLDRAEVLKQIRDEERNSFEQRKTANDKLGKVINEREAESIAFQEKRLKNLQALLNQDKGNLEIQKAIKQVEFEIADIREEAQGFRSEQLANDLALSREFNANEIELTKERIRTELIEVEKGSEEELNLRKELAEETYKLELQLAGQNQQLREISKQKFLNDIKELERAYIESNKSTLEAIKLTNNEVDLSNAATQLKGLDDFKKTEEEKTRKLREEEQKRAELRQAWTQFGFDAAQDISSTAFSIAAANRDAETEAEITALQERLDNEVLDAEQRENLQKQINAKEKKLRADKAKADRNAALFEVGINTGIGIAKTIANLGFPIAIPFVAAVAAQGALQAALIAARPIPQFDKGTKSLPELSEVAEKRPEFVLNKGRVELFKQPTLLGSDYKGAEVISGTESARILDQINRGQVIENISRFNDNVQDRMIAAAIDKSFEKHIDRQTRRLIQGLKHQDKTPDYRYLNSMQKYGQ